MDEKLVAAARAFKAAALALDDAWTSALNDDATADGATKLDEDYPFGQSFDEVATEIVGWLNEKKLGGVR